MKVLVTGGSGFVGRAVLARLGAAGHRARVLIRPQHVARGREVAESLGAETAPGDVLAPDSIAAGMAGCEAVVHLVGVIGEVGANTFDNAHRVATANVVQAAEAAGVRRYLHMSALGTRPHAASNYHRSKWAGEAIVRQSRLAWTIFRPSLIYGSGDRFVNMFARMSRWSPVLPVIGKGQARLQPVAVDAVAQAFVAALGESRAVGETLDLCGPEALTFVEVLDHVLAVLGRRRLKLHVPLPLARWQASWLEWVFPRWLHRAPPLNRDQILMLQEDNVGNPEPAHRLFRLPMEPFREGIARQLGRQPGGHSIGRPPSR